MTGTRWFALTAWLKRAKALPRRWALWLLLVVLVGALLGILVWLASRFETAQWQEKLERDSVEAASELRSALTRDVQTLQALDGLHTDANAWSIVARSTLQQNRHLLRIELRGVDFQLVQAIDTPFRAGVTVNRALGTSLRLSSEAQAACTTARRLSAPAYGTSFFVPDVSGYGVEVMELCQPLFHQGKSSGYVLTTYGLQASLAELVNKQFVSNGAISFTEADGTRLASHGSPQRGDLRFSATQLIDLPGFTMVLRMDRGRAAPNVFPNVLTALVTLLSFTLVTVLVLLGRDMRLRQRAEGELAQALAFRKAMEDSLSTGLRARDLNGRITYVNPAFCAMVGYGASQLLGTTHPAPYWPPELIEEYKQRQITRFANKTGTREGFETIFQHHSGSRFTAWVIEAPLIDAKGLQTGWMSAVLDVSVQRKAEELARASLDRLAATARLASIGEMASLISHELNQPLAAISSYAAGAINLIANNDRDCSTNSDIDGSPTLANCQLDIAQFRQAIERIAQQAERAGKVIKSVNDVVRRRDRAREWVEPQDLIAAVLPLVELQARKNGVRVGLHVQAGLSPVLCDRTLVEQVLLNLARNGIQAMGEVETSQRELTLHAKKGASNARHQWLEFSVSDTGVGISPEVGKQLFTAFFTTKSEGMGLGLSLCRTVVEQHGGALQFRANTPHGTVFSFTLAAQMAPTAATAAPPTA